MYIYIIYDALCMKYSNSNGGVVKMTEEKVSTRAKKLTRKKREYIKTTLRLFNIKLVQN